MFGPKLRLEENNFGVTLTPLKKEWLKYYAEGMSSLSINMFTNGTYGYTIEDEEDWYQKIRTDKQSVLWAIIPDGSDLPVGSTSLHGIDSVSGSSSTGIIIFDQNWWGKGVASRAHLLRTWFAADILCRLTIQSTVREPNTASRKALERVGYIVTGRTLRNAYRQGEYIDTLHLTWLHPEKHVVLYPDGFPTEYQNGINHAMEALKKARNLKQIL
jgi:RimJ/RimL family protein N-acetyltransferase